MAFNTQEQEIIKYGVANGKTRQEVEQAISNLRSGVVPKKKVETATTQEPGLGSKLKERATDLASELTLKPSRDILVGAADTTGQERELAGLEAFNRAFQSPARVAMAAGGAIGDVVGAGIKATGLDKTIAENISPVAKPVVQSEGARKLVENFQKLPAETQDYLKGIPDIANLIGLEVIPGAVAKTASKMATKNVLNTTAFDAIKSSGGNLTQKAVDFISSDPSAKVETILKRSTPQELDNYLSIAEKSSVSGEAKTVFETVGDKLADTTKILNTKLGEIGKAKSDIIEPMREGLGSFTNETKPFISKLTSLKNSFTEIDKGNKSIVQAIIDDAKTISTKRDADIFIDKVQNALYTGNIDMTIPRGSALDKQLKGILGEYNSSLKKSLPKEYADLNEQYSKLIDSLDTINRSLGEVVEGVPVRGASLIKQYFSPSGSKAKEIFEFIKKETNGEVDLAKDATLAKFAGQLYDDPNVNSLLAGIKDIPTTPSAIIGKVAERLGGEKVSSSLRESTVRKAKSSTLRGELPKVDKQTTTPTESKLLPSTQSTPTPTKGKGIRGMVNPSELLPKKKVVSSLEQEAKKYKTTVNIQDKNDLEYLGRILSNDQIADIKAGKMTNFRGTPYEDLARVNIISETPKTAAQQLEGKIKVITPKSNIFYHGTTNENANSILKGGFKKGSQLPASTVRGGGYGKLQDSVSFAETPKEASIFSTLTRDGKVIKSKLKDDAKIVQIDGITDAVELNDYISYLKKEGIDAVYIGGGEKEMVVINPKAVTPIEIVK